MNPVAHTPWRPSSIDAHRGFADDAARRGHRDDRAAQPRHRYRCGLRSARRRSRRRARPGGRRAPARAARRPDRRRRWPTPPQRCSAASRPDGDTQVRGRGEHHRRPTSATSIASCASSSGPASTGFISMSWTATSCPNITFGPDVVAAIRRLSRLPIDAHLMISEPARYMDRFIAAGADTITFHVEVDGERRVEARDARADPRRRPRPRPGRVAATRRRVRVRDFLDELGHHHGHDRRAGLRRRSTSCPSRRPRSPRRARCSAIGRAPRCTSMAASARDTAGIVGGYGVDVCVVGSALFQRGQDAAVEVNAVKREARGRAQIVGLALSSAAAASARDARPGHASSGRSRRARSARVC